MKKKEIIILIAIAAVAFAVIVGVQIYNKATLSKDVVQIISGSEIVQEFDPTKDAVYSVEGSYGHLEVEVKDSKWRVTNEECPNHICSEMGWMSVDDYFPIICIPNGVVVQLKSK